MAALAPAYVFYAPSPACGATPVSGAVTTPIDTATISGGSPDDIDIPAGASVGPTAAGAAVTLDSNNSITNEGTIAFSNVSNATGVLLNGYSGSLTNSGAITLGETTISTDTNGDGILDPPFASGSGRYGIRLVGPTALVGSIANTGTISVTGNDSFGISLEAPLTGSLSSSGAITNSGDRSVAIRETAGVSGDVNISTAITARGLGAQAINLSGDIGNHVTISGVITATGYAATVRGTDAVVAKLTQQDFQLSGPAVQISGNVGAGVFVFGPVPATTSDVDGNGVEDDLQSASTITGFGSAPALQIGAAGAATHLGVFGAADPGANDDSAWGLIVRGALKGAGVYDAIPAIGLQIGTGQGAVTVDNGMRVVGSISGAAQQADALGVHIESGASVPTIRNEGTLSASVTSKNANMSQALLIDSGATVNALYNLGAINAVITGSTGQANAVADRSGSLSNIYNYGTIGATITAATTGAAVTGRTVALDLSANTSGITLLQGALNTAAPSITGNILLGSGANTVQLLAGTVTGDLALGAGADSVLINGGASYIGALTHGAGTLNLDVESGKLRNTTSQTLALNTLTVGSGGTILFALDPAKGANTNYQVSGPATLAAGSGVGVELLSPLALNTTLTVPVITASNLSVASSANLASALSPLFYVVNSSVSNNSLLVAVRRSSAAELSLTGARATIFDPAYQASFGDAQVKAAFDAVTDRTALGPLYDQLTPDHGDAMFVALRGALSDLSMRTGERGNQAPAPLTVASWVTQYLFGADQKEGDNVVSSTNGLAFAGGIEGTGPHRTLGATLAAFAGTTRDSAQADHTRIYWWDLEAGLNFRQAFGPVRADGRFGVGYLHAESDRTFTLTGANALTREAKATWPGVSIAGHLGLTYDLLDGPFYVRPNLSADYLRLQENSHSESNGGAAMDLQFSQRASEALDASAKLVTGMMWGGDKKWGPELQAGWTTSADCKLGETTAQFGANGAPFTLAADKLSGSGPLARVGFTVRSDYMDINIGAGASRVRNVTNDDISARLRFYF